MPVTNDQLLRLKGFPQGINNVAREDALPTDENGIALAARQAVNVDLNSQGKPERRRGYTLAKVLQAPHSGFGDWPEALLCVAGGSLIGLDAALNATTIRAGVGPSAISYAPVNLDCYWSNGQVIRKVTPDLVDAHAFVGTPPQPSVTAQATGGLDAGTYQIAITAMDADGMESGSTLATLVEVPAGGGIVVSNLVADSAEMAWLRLYVTGANGDVLYHARDVPTGVTQWTIGKSQRGKAMETQWLLPLPPGRILRLFNGRLYSASDAIRWSEPMNYGLTRNDNYIRYPNITMMEPVGHGAASGMFVGNDKRTLWLPGPDPKVWQQTLARPTGVVPGTGRNVPASWFGLESNGDVAFWLDTDGVFCLGLASGQVMPLTEGRVALPEYQQGAVLLQEKSGIRQIIAALIGGGTNNFAASDSAVATIRKHGDATAL